MGFFSIEVRQPVFAILDSMLLSSQRLERIIRVMTYLRPDVCESGLILVDP